VIVDTCSAFADLLLDDHGFAERGDIAQVGWLKRRRRRRSIKLRRGVLEKRHQFGKALVGRTAQRECLPQRDTFQLGNH
jgi:hypothetical protein